MTHSPLVRVKNGPGLHQVTLSQRKKLNEACQHRLHFPSRADKESAGGLTAGKEHSWLQKVVKSLPISNQ